MHDDNTKFPRDYFQFNFRISNGQFLIHAQAGAGSHKANQGLYSFVFGIWGHSEINY
jgi:hypothetical protein